MKKNKVNIEDKNDSLISLIKDPKQIITLDANFFIPPDRSRQIHNMKPMPFSFFKEIWLKPLFEHFPNISIHEAVYDEIVVLQSLKLFVDCKIKSTPPQLYVLYDKSLNEKESILRNTLEVYIAIPTNYNPDIDNSDDRGEVKSLAYIATRGLLYFCSHDANALRLIEDTVRLNTKLENVQAVHTYEIIYYLSKFTENKNALKTLYKYMYYATNSDKEINLEWGKFIECMDKLYLTYF
jgi:hypothetical protein